MKFMTMLLDRRTQFYTLVTILILLILGVSFSSGTSTQTTSSSSSNSSSTPSTSSSGSSLQAPESVIMTFDSMGGSLVDSITITNGEQNTAPANPSRDFSNFQGWYYEETYVRPLNFQFDFISTPALNDLVVYAKWSTNSATFQFVYLNQSNNEVLVSTQFIPMLSCADDFEGDQYGLTIPTLPVSQNINEFTYEPWDLSVLPACLNDVSHYNVKIFAPRLFKEYTRTLAASFNVNQIKDIELTSALSGVVLSYDDKVYSVGSNGIFNVPQLNGTSDSNAVGVFPITALIPLNPNEKVVDLVAMYTGSNPSFSIRPGILMVTNQSRILDYRNVTLHNTGNGFVDITSKFNFAVGETITEVVSGSEFLVVLTSNNRLVGLGNLPSYPGTNFNNPTVVNSTGVFGADTMDDISAGYRSVAVRTSTGKAAVFGANIYGQIGLDPNVYSNSAIRLLSDFTNVSLIEATQERIYMVADQGARVQKVFGSGLYIYDTLGGDANQDGFIEITKFDTANDYYQPLAGNETITQIVGAPLDTLFMTSTGRILTIGPNMSRMTHPNAITNTTLPDQLNATTLRDTTSYLGTFDASTDRLLTVRGLSNSEALFFAINQTGSIRGSGVNKAGMLGSLIAANQVTSGMSVLHYNGFQSLGVETIAFGTGFSVPDPEAIPGYVFTGWSLSADGPIHLQPGGLVGMNMPSYNIILYARYQAQ